MKITNKHLQDFFIGFNKRFFDSRISNKTKVRFEDTEDSDGLSFISEREIWIHEDLKDHPDLAMFVLIHEMAHMDPELDTYIGSKGQEDHGMRFQAKIDELYKAGAYDGLL